MNLDFLSGLLLITVTLAIVFFVAKEIFGDRRAGDRQAQRHWAHALEWFSGSETKPVNEHLIGSAGEVISHSGDSARPMRVRLGFETWPARPGSTEDNPLPVGSAVEVIEVDGAVLVVVAGSDPAGLPNGR
ncbi:MAG: NfeD family protein [Gammaproteobacteria bacterium]|nr:NfeD family protein [Gammaproteobacteria bacterium]MDH3508331.1 NfeD family protein [Gammaproteobacteria bacterium]